MAVQHGVDGALRGHLDIAMEPPHQQFANFARPPKRLVGAKRSRRCSRRRAFERGLIALPNRLAGRIDVPRPGGLGWPMTNVPARRHAGFIEAQLSITENGRLRGGAGRTRTNHQSVMEHGGCPTSPPRRTPVLALKKSAIDGLFHKRGISRNPALRNGPVGPTWTARRRTPG